MGHIELDIDDLGNAVNRIDGRCNCVIGGLDVALDGRLEPVDGILQKVGNLEGKLGANHNCVLTTGLTSVSAPIIIARPPRTTSSKKQRKIDRYISMTNSMMP